VWWVAFWWCFIYSFPATLLAEPIKVVVSPRVAFAPAPIRVRVIIEPIATDRWLRVELDSAEGMYRSSVWPLEGDTSARVWWVYWKDLSAGEYALAGSLGSYEQVRSIYRTTLQLLGR
jgi:hypothetical protein